MFSLLRFSSLGFYHLHPRYPYALSFSHSSWCHLCVQFHTGAWSASVWQHCSSFSPAVVVSFAFVGSGARTNSSKKASKAPSTWRAFKCSPAPWKKRFVILRSIRPVPPFPGLTIPRPQFKPHAAACCRVQRCHSPWNLENKYLQTTPNQK